MTNRGCLNTRVINLSPFELEQMLESELSQLGLEHFVVMIIGADRQPLFQHVCGFNQQQMHTYQTHMAHDMFLRYYTQKGYLGRLLYMQEMLPMRRISDPVFNEILVPTMALYHSYSGLERLSNHHYVMLSSHSDSNLSYRGCDKVQAVWRFLTAWGEYWLAQRAMSSQLSLLRYAPQSLLPLEELTQAELMVLNMLAQGMDGSEVARRRNVSKETVRSQIKQILHKTGCRHQNQLLTRYFQSGLNDSTMMLTLSLEPESLI
ncbi:helix-turn-helix transcriptional regulator [Vibrio sp. WXL103]|uniref:helix-turn-helix transcriptional regulator n=1 Tax=Vibrio sp. WXL103 TaxID=3450710 RepID=UPI003EC4B9F1